MKTLHRLSAVTLFLSILLVTLGGVVHNTGSSLACPDWPLCYGQIMPKMEGSVAIEHSHRLLASFVGILCIALLWTASRIRNKYPYLFKISFIALGVVIFQGLLGGLTVVLRISPLVSTAHLATSQIFIGLLLLLFFNTRTLSAEIDPLPERPPPPRLLQGLKWAALLLYFQMCLGAFIRHGGQSMACGLGWESAFLCLDGTQEGGTLIPSTLEALVHMFHRFMALITTLVIVWATLPLLKLAKINRNKNLKFLIYSLYLLLFIQISLGVLTISSGIAIPFVTAHLFVGMLAWMNIFTQNLFAHELLSPLPNAPTFSWEKEELLEAGI